MVIVVANSEEHKNFLKNQIERTGNKRVGDRYVVKKYDELTKAQKEKIDGEPPFSIPPKFEK